MLQVLNNFNQSFSRNLMAMYYKSITESNTVNFPRQIESLYHLM